MFSPSPAASLTTPENVARFVLFLSGGLFPMLAAVGYLRAFLKDDYHALLGQMYDPVFLKSPDAKAGLHALGPFLGLLYFTTGML